MAELIQHILSLPKAQQLAIVQAILVGLQIDETGSDPAQIQKQIDHAEMLFARVKSGEEKTFNKEEFFQRFDQFRNNHLGA